MATKANTERLQLVRNISLTREGYKVEKQGRQISKGEGFEGKGFQAIFGATNNFASVPSGRVKN